MVIGVPRAMSMIERYPFWHRYFTRIGVDVVFSRQTDPRIAADGVDMAIAQPCFPIQVAHGHALALAEMGVDYIFVPNLLNAEASAEYHCIAHLCPWNQTLPFVLKTNPRLEPHWNKVLAPTLHFQLGRDHVKKALAGMAQKLGVKKRLSDAAVDAAYAVQRDFQERLIQEGQRALLTLEETGQPGIVLVGRGYNIYDRNVNCDIPRKMRHHYGANVIPIDFLVTGREDISDLHPNMYWSSGQKILETARLASRHENLHVIYISNFKCGPDSYIKYFAREAAGQPYLVLQFDGHGNDAGYMTRVEAYLDSKGILRCYSKSPAARAKTASSTTL
jgi:predicted nucleotide-binding protein (sugar kinase/HSP70/actin superfamily)